MTTTSTTLSTSAEFRDHVLGAAEPVLVEFTAAWCAPCRAMAPILEELAARHAGRVRVAVVDVEVAPELAQTYRVTAMPTLLAFHGGQVVAHVVGFSGRRALERMFDELAARPAHGFAAADAGRTLTSARSAADE